MDRLLKKIAKFIKKNRRTSYDKVTEIFLSLQNGLTLLDIGAAGGLDNRWTKVTKHLNYIAVEADERSNNELEKKIFRNQKVLKTFAWNEKVDIEFNLCKKAMVSSAYKPNKEILDQFPNSQRFEIIQKEIMQAEPLFNKLEDQKIDFLKLDIQGGELNALKGIGDSLDDCLGIEIEIEFSEIYESQPLFGDVHRFLSSRGFYFCDFLTLNRWEREPYTSFGRCMFGDGLWLRELKTLKSKNSETYLKYIAICSIYGKLDEATHILKYLGESAPKRFKKILFEQLAHQKKERRNFYLFRKLWNLYSPKTKLFLME